MLNFENMILPSGTSVDEVITTAFSKIAKIGALKAPFETVRVGGMRYVESNPEVRLAWQQRMESAQAKKNDAS